MDVRVHTTLPASVDTPAAARAVVRDAVERGRTSVRIEDVALVVSELVTNAVLHGDGDITLEVVVDDAAVHIAVADSAGDVTTPFEVSPDSESGRGLILVGKIAAQWGVRPAADGKVVWADIAC